VTLIQRGFPLAVLLQMDCRISYPIDGVKCTRVGPILLVGEFLMERTPGTAMSLIGCSRNVGVVVNVKGLNLMYT